MVEYTFTTKSCGKEESHMPTKKHVEVTKESPTGRNEKFHDNRTGADMTRAQFVKEIERGNYDDFAVRKINDIKTPVSKPDGNKHNNLDD
jgi:hypothetical protein